MLLEQSNPEEGEGQVHHSRMRLLHKEEGEEEEEEED